MASLTSLENLEIKTIHSSPNKESSQSNLENPEQESPGVSVPLMLPKFLMSSTSSKSAKTHRSTHLLESRPKSKFIRPKDDCDLPLSLESSNICKNVNSFERERDCAKLDLNRLPAQQMVIKIKGQAKTEHSASRLPSSTHYFDSLSALESKSHEITTKKGFYKYVDNISSLASMGQTSTMAPSSQSKLKDVLTAKLTKAIQIDLKTYKGLTEEPRVGSVPNLKSILNKPQVKPSKLGPKLNVLKVQQEPLDQSATKRVSFAENKILIVYHDARKA